MSLIVAVLGTGTAAAQEEKKPDFKIDGRINLEIRMRPGYRRSDLPKEAVVQIETRRRSGFQGGVDVRLAEDIKGIDLHEVFIDFKDDADRRLIVGRGKKRFGLDWDYDLESLLPLARGIVHRKLSSLGYTGRDSMIAFQRGNAKNKNQDEIGPSQQWSVHTSEGINGAVLHRYLLRRSETSLWASYTLFQIEDIEDERIAAGAQAVAYSGIWGDFRIETQGVLGVDAFATKYERHPGSGRTVFFSGAQASLEWRPGSLCPFGATAVVLDDLARLGRSQIELGGGARYYFTRRTYLGAEGRYVRSKDGVLTAYDRESLGLLALRYFF